MIIRILFIEVVKVRFNSSFFVVVVILLIVEINFIKDTIIMVMVEVRFTVTMVMFTTIVM